MDLYFPSKRDAWLGALLAAVVLLQAVPLAGAILGGRAASVPVIIPIAVTGFIGWVWFTTGYTLAADALRIRSGPFRWTVPYRDITAVRPTHNPLSSPALSLDRLRVEYGRNRAVLVSPADRQGFCAALRQRCPSADIPA